MPQRSSVPMVSTNQRLAAHVGDDETVLAWAIVDSHTGRLTVESAAVGLPARLVLVLTNRALHLLHERRWRTPVPLATLDRSQIDRATLRRTTARGARHELVIRLHSGERLVASVGGAADGAAELALRLG